MKTAPIAGIGIVAPGLVPRMEGTAMPGRERASAVPCDTALRLALLRSGAMQGTLRLRGRIGLHLSSSSLSRLERTLDCAGSNHLETIPHIALNTVHPGAAQGSLLMLPVMP